MLATQAYDVSFQKLAALTQRIALIGENRKTPPER